MLWLFATLAAGVARAEPSYFALTVDNDYFARADRHYTSGLQLATGTDIANVPGWVRALPPVAWSADSRAAFAVGQRIYTPSDLQRSPPDPADRPYAGWSYFLTEVRTQAGATIDRASLSLGIIGPASGARQFHRLSHHILGSKEPNGWGAQLHDEVGALVGFDRTWMNVAKGQGGHVRTDLALHAGATLGNVFTYASAGFVGRIGSLLPDDVPVTRISLAPVADGFRGAPGTGWYGWLAVEARAVAWNVFLDGNSFRDSAGVDRKPFGYDVQLGIAHVWPAARLGFALVRRNAEFTGQHGPDRYGEITLALSY